MEIISSIFSYISGLGKYLMVPLMVALIGLAFKAKPERAIKGGITVGIGLFGLDLALSLVSTYLGPVASSLVEKAHLNLEVIDVGWTALSGIAYSTSVGAFAIPFFVLFNIVLLAVGATKTMDIDIWNYWHYALTGSLITVLTGNMLLGFLAASAHAVVIFAFGDRWAEQSQEIIGIPGISLPHGGNVLPYMVAPLTEKLFNLFNKNKEEKAESSSSDVEKLTNNAFMRIVKDPIYDGFFLGTILGFVAGQNVKGAFTTGMAMAALLYLTPRMVKILMEGLVPISNAVKKIMKERYKGQQLYIGMDTAIGLGHPTVMLCTVIMIPILIALCVIVPGNTIIPMASLAACGYVAVIPCIIHKGKFGRSLVTSIILEAIYLVGSSLMAGVITKVALGAGYQTEYAVISSISGDLCVAGVEYFLFNISNIVGIVFCLVVIVGTVILQRMYFKKKLDLSTREFIDAEKSSYVDQEKK